MVQRRMRAFVLNAASRRSYSDVLRQVSEQRREFDPLEAGVNGPLKGPNMISRYFATCLLIPVFLTPAQAAEPAKKLLSIEDLYHREAARSPVLLPDGKRLVYTRHWIDPTTKQERNALWIV